MRGHAGPGVRVASEQTNHWLNYIRHDHACNQPTRNAAPGGAALLHTCQGEVVISGFRPIRGHHVPVQADLPQELEDLLPRQPARLWRADARCNRRVQSVHVHRDVDVLTQQGQRPIDTGGILGDHTGGEIRTAVSSGYAGNSSQD